MGRPIWRGHITFGLVNIPVVVHSVEKQFDLHFRLLDSRNHACVRYDRVNEETGEEVPWHEIVKGFEYEEGRYVTLTAADFEKVAVEVNKSVEIESFVDGEDIGYVYFDKLTSRTIWFPIKKAKIVAPLNRRTTWDDLKIYTKQLAMETARKDPDGFVAAMSKAKRTGKIFIDYLRNRFGATSIATYGTRALSGSSVFIPVSWNELSSYFLPGFHSGHPSGPSTQSE